MPTCDGVKRKRAAHAESAQHRPLVAAISHPKGIAAHRTRSSSAKGLGVLRRIVSADAKCRPCCLALRLNVCDQHPRPSGATSPRADSDARFGRGLSLERGLIRVAPIEKRMLLLSANANGQGEQHQRNQHVWMRARHRRPPRGRTLTRSTAPSTPSAHDSLLRRPNFCTTYSALLRWMPANRAASERLSLHLRSSSVQ